jgi:hypothetical protein
MKDVANTLSSSFAGVENQFARRSVGGLWGASVGRDQAHYHAAELLSDRRCSDRELSKCFGQCRGWRLACWFSLS